MPAWRSAARSSEVSEEDFEWLFEINFWGVVRMTRAFLPLLKSSGDARIVNLSSIFGIIAPPGQTAYSASKFAVRGFSQALRHELEGTRIGVTVVHPGGVATGIARNARISKAVSAEEEARGREEFDRLLRLPPRGQPGRSSSGGSYTGERACWSALMPRPFRSLSAPSLFLMGPFWIG